MGRLGFLFTITGFWLRRMALALRMAACRQGRLRSLPLGACAPTLCSQSAGPAPQSGEDHPSQLPRAPAHLLGPALLTMRKSGRYLFFRIMCRMLLRVARAFLLMVVRT